MRRYPSLLFVLFLFIVVPVVAGQEAGSCPFAPAAQMEAVCSELAPGMACVAGGRVAAELREGSAFSEPGDMIFLQVLESLELGPDAVVHAKVQIDGQVVDLIAYGSIQMSNASPVFTTVTVGQRLNVRQGPGTSYTAIGALEPGRTYVVFGRTAAGDWLRVRFGDAPFWEYGWVAASFTSSAGDLAQLAILDPEEAPGYYEPLAALTVSGDAEADCSGLLIQTQSQTGPLAIAPSMLINGAQVNISGTAAVQGMPDGSYVVRVFDGYANAETEESGSFAVPGTQFLITPAAEVPPTLAGPAPYGDPGPAPVDLLPVPVEVPESMLQEEIDEALANFTPLPGVWTHRTYIRRHTCDTTPPSGFPWNWTLEVEEGGSRIFVTMVFDFSPPLNIVLYRIGLNQYSGWGTWTVHSPTSMEDYGLIEPIGRHEDAQGNLICEIWDGYTLTYVGP